MSNSTHINWLRVYKCPNGHEDFYSVIDEDGYISTACPDCQASGIYARHDGVGSLIREPRPVLPARYVFDDRAISYDDLLPRVGSAILRALGPGQEAHLPWGHYLYRSAPH